MTTHRQAPRAPGTTARRTEVIGLVARGYTNKAIAAHRLASARPALVLEHRTALTKEAGGDADGHDR